MSQLPSRPPRGMLARYRTGPFKNAEASSSISRLGYLQLQIHLTSDYPYLDVMPVTSANQVIAVRAKITGFTFCTITYHFVVFSDQSNGVCCLSTLAGVPYVQSRTIQCRTGYQFTERRMASSSALSALFASGPPRNGGYRAVIGPSPSPAVSTRCCNSAPRQGAMKRP
ncbi:hypothetical protein F5B17DRAFT_16826 [Nemania serpens]|nr:hypothetical protein F5B17DRAFT_16826 [Nemania serpens]